ncbi:hypothetical protein Mapa_015082 [Marchantia paleacea]|nr:hypothetical protein Mapa_015082 [Marchantia paleacea]
MATPLRHSFRSYSAFSFPPLLSPHSSAPLPLKTQRPTRTQPPTYSHRVPKRSPPSQSSNKAAMPSHCIVKHTPFRYHYSSSSSHHPPSSQTPTTEAPHPHRLVVLLLLRPFLHQTHSTPLPTTLSPP